MSRTSSEDTSTNKHPGFKSESPPLVSTAGMLVITLFLPDPLLAAAAAAALAASSALASCWVFQGSLPKGHQEGDSSSDKSLHRGQKERKKSWKLLHYYIRAVFVLQLLSCSSQQHQNKTWTRPSNKKKCIISTRSHSQLSTNKCLVRTP